MDITEINNTPISFWINEKANQVVFKEYEESDESIMEKYLADIYNSHIIGIEQEDGSVVVFKDTARLKRPLRNKKAFIKKYFVEAL